MKEIYISQEQNYINGLMLWRMIKGFDTEKYLPLHWECDTPKYGSKEILSDGPWHKGTPPHLLSKVCTEVWSHASAKILSTVLLPSYHIPSITITRMRTSVYYLWTTVRPIWLWLRVYLFWVYTLQYQKLLLALHPGIILQGDHMRFSGLMLHQPCACTVNLAPDKSIFKVVLCPVHLGC